MAIFRVEKTRDYTVMSNHHLKNRSLSLKAKGLLSLILSLPNDWDYTMKGLAAISMEGVDAVRQALAELEKQGYVTRSRVRDEKGLLRGSEYVIYEQPHGFKEPEPDTPVQEKPACASPMQEPPISENPMSENPVLENRAQLSTKERNTYPVNTYPIQNATAANPNPSNPYPSILSGGHEGSRVRCERTGIVAVEAYRDAVRKRIEYDVLAQDAHIGQGRLDEVVEIMAETLSATNAFMTIAGNEYPMALVQERFRQIGSRHIQYVFQCLNKNTSRIRNIKKYLLAVLFNAPGTMDGYYAALINHDFGNMSLDDFDC